MDSSSTVRMADSFMEKYHLSRPKRGPLEKNVYRLHNAKTARLKTAILEKKSRKVGSTSVGATAKKRTKSHRRKKAHRGTSKKERFRSRDKNRDQKIMFQSFYEDIE
jgi:hypothetical protein